MNITPEYAQRLQEALEIKELPVTSLSTDIERKQKVHLILAEMCGNRIFEVLMKSLLGLTKRVIEAVNPDPNVVHPKGMHLPIVHPVLTKEDEAAASAMKKHAIEFGENLLKMELAFRQTYHLAPL